MYNPSRGGVRGGADQFTWESVKTDKHRENYLGHSLMAPVGRWQKGKDLSWYSKGRKDDKTQEAIDRSELAFIKKAEEEAMLIALGHNIVKKTQTLTKEDMREALQRNTEREDYQIERIDGVGAASQRIASLSGVGKNVRQKNEGVVFESVRERNIREANDNDKEEEFMSGERKKVKKKSKKHKKDKKHRKHHKESHDSDSSENKMKYKKGESEEDIKSSKMKHSKKSKHRHEDYYSDSDSFDNDNTKSSKLKNHKTSKHKSRDYVDSDLSDSEGEKSSKVKNHKKSKIRQQDYSSDSDSAVAVLEHKTKHKKRHLESDDKKSLKEKSHKKSKNRHKYDDDKTSDNSDEKFHSDFQKTDHKRHKKQKEYVKRHRHDTSESE